MKVSKRWTTDTVQTVRLIHSSIFNNQLFLVKVRVNPDPILDGVCEVGIYPVQFYNTRAPHI